MKKRMTDKTGWPDHGSDNSRSQEIAVSQTFASQAPPPSKFIRLGSIRQIRYELAAVYRLARNGQIASGEATRFTYILTQLANLTMESQIEERIESLERGT